MNNQEPTAEFSCPGYVYTDRPTEITVFTVKFCGTVTGKKTQTLKCIYFYGLTGTFSLPQA